MRGIYEIWKLESFNLENPVSFQAVFQQSSFLTGKRPQSLTSLESRVCTVHLVRTVLIGFQSDMTGDCDRVW